MSVYLQHIFLRHSSNEKCMVSVWKVELMGEHDLGGLQLVPYHRVIRTPNES